MSFHFLFGGYWISNVMQRKWVCEDGWNQWSVGALGELLLIYVDGVDFPEAEPLAPQMSRSPWGACLLPVLQSLKWDEVLQSVTWGQQWYAEAGSPPRVTQWCSVQHPLHFCCQVQKHVLGWQPSMCSSGCCHRLWRRAEQSRLSEIWRGLYWGCAAGHREHHGQGRITVAVLC